MFRPILLFVLFFVMGISDAYSQTIDSTGVNSEANEKEAFNLKDRIFFGGNAGGGITNNQLVINLAPLVGVRITDRYSAGLQANYTYARIRFPGYSFNDHIIGGSIFNRYFVWRDLFLHAEAEMLNAEWTTGAERSNIYNLMAGGGYMFRFGSNGGFSIMALYNFTPNPYGVRQNPFINMGFTFGL